MINKKDLEETLKVVRCKNSILRNCIHKKFTIEKLIEIVSLIEGKNIKELQEIHEKYLGRKYD